MFQLIKTFVHLMNVSHVEITEKSKESVKGLKKSVKSEKNPTIDVIFNHLELEDRKMFRLSVKKSRQCACGVDNKGTRTKIHALSINAMSSDIAEELNSLKRTSPFKCQHCNGFGEENMKYNFKKTQVLLVTNIGESDESNAFYEELPQEFCYEQYKFTLKGVMLRGGQVVQRVPDPVDPSNVDVLIYVKLDDIKLTNMVHDEEYGHRNNEANESVKALMIDESERFESLNEDCQQEELQQVLCSFCDDSCPDVDYEMGGKVHAELSLLAGGSIQDVSAQVLSWIEQHSPCYQGLRSIKTRLKKIGQYTHSLVQLENTPISRNAMTAVINSLPISQKIKDTVWGEFDVKRDDASHVESRVIEKYGKLIDSFKTAMRNKMDDYCGVCQLMTPQDILFNRNVVDVRFALNDDVHRCSNCNRKRNCDACKEMKVKVCRPCWKHLRNNNVPPLAKINGLDFDPVPPEISQLNCIERMLICKARVIQKIVRLKKVIQSDNGMAASGGPMVVVPTSPENNVNLVLTKLPSSKHMEIHVHSTWDKKYIVDMVKVIQALNMLKRVNTDYEDVEIDEDFHFTIDEDVVFETPGKTQQDADDLVKRCSDPSVFLEHIPVQPIQTVNQPRGTSLKPQEFQLKKISSDPLWRQDENAELRAFVDLFSKRRGGQYSPRETKLNDAQYFRAVILNKQRDVAKSMYWLCYQYARKMQKSITSCQGVQACLNKKLNNVVDWENPDFVKSLSTVFNKVRGFRQFWSVVKKRLMFYVAKYGNPTFFVTLNPNVEEWRDLHSIYTKHCGHCVDGNNIRAVINADPVPFSRYWRTRVNVFLKNVILAKGGPLGNVSHYFIRTEYQQRGLQHAHCLFWCSDKPERGANQEVIRAYLDEHITARMPEDTEVALKKLVSSVQSHYEDHSTTCKRYRVVHGDRREYCRFNFPRNIRGRTAVFVSDDDALESNVRAYELARKVGEQFLNDYNPALLLGWNGNVDMQYVGDSKHIVNYLTYYATKGEVSKKRAEEFNEELCRSRIIYKMGIDELNSREVGALEMIDILLGHRTHFFDQGEVWVCTDESTVRPRMMKRNSSATGDSFAPNLLDTYYPQRSKDLESCSLYNVASNYRIMSDGCRNETKNAAEENSENEEDEELLEMGGETSRNVLSPFYRPEGNVHKVQRSNMVMKLMKQKVVRFYVPAHNDSDPKQSEDFYRRMCLLFVPWRNEDRILSIYNKDTYFETFMCYLNSVKIKSSTAYDDIVSCLDTYRHFRSDQQNAARRIQQIKEAKANEDDEEDVPLFELQQRPNVTEEEMKEQLAKLNEQQQQLFDEVIKQIEAGVTPVRKFCSGTAGVGKSFVIHCLTDYLELRKKDREREQAEKDSLERPAVLLAAPTGFAAISIRGQTLHVLLGIRVPSNGKLVYDVLPDHQRDLRRNMFEHVQLLIIDEVSMVSSVMLQFISRRLKEIMGSDEEFGGMSILVFGDLLQLKPVAASYIFEGITPHLAKSVFGGLGPGANLWSTFDYFELTQNMRQREDLEYAQLLGRIRRKALECEDEETLRARIIPGITSEETELDVAAMYYHTISMNDPKALALFPKVIQVSEFNRKVLVLKATNLLKITAIETITRRKNTTNPRPHQYAEYSIEVKAKKATQSKVSTVHSEAPVDKLEKYCFSKTGLRAEITIAKNVRVILTRTVNRLTGLVNGLTGVVEDITFDCEGTPFKIGVRFDMIPNEINWIARVSNMYEKKNGERRMRTQFPLDVAYGVSIHKSQGMTLDNVIIDTRLDMSLSFQNMKTAAKFIGLSVSSLKWIILSPGHFAINLMIEDEIQPKIIFKLAQTSPHEFVLGSANGKLIRFARSGNVFTVKCGPSVQDKLQLLDDLTHELLWILKVEKFYLWSTLFVDFVFRHTQKFENVTMEVSKIQLDMIKFMFERLKVVTLKLTFVTVQTGGNQNSVHIPIVNFVRKWFKGESDNFNNISISIYDQTHEYLIDRCIKEELRCSETQKENDGTKKFYRRGDGKRVMIESSQKWLNFNVLN
ncbi:hypothetical protein CAEBREN_00364 [Caenorhabditis brenneri]|uniref:ATP-dependent DNA helicase n=1 Tax=Caenorhabditis brenneri TaxID=135651 RepID=G0P9F1_CAEBE|nr:hypothetical protein CAEBREN_00364 [Caenorhabditis brenneri]